MLCGCLLDYGSANGNSYENNNSEEGFGSVGGVRGREGGGER